MRAEMLGQVRGVETPFGIPLEDFLDDYFWRCLEVSLLQEGLLQEFDRLRGTNLMRYGTGIDLLIDEATGRTKADIQAFMKFVHDAIYLRTRSAEVA